MKKLLVALLMIINICTGCEQAVTKNNQMKVGLLLSETINEPVWGSKGYKGLLKIQSSLHVDVYYKEGIKTKEDVKEQLLEFRQEGVNLVFGHGNEYGAFFADVHKDFPDLDFVYFNGDFSAENVTSIKFDSYAMGFFGGMIAAKMSKTNNIGVIAAFDWQPEVDGFMEGAKYQNPVCNVMVTYINSWNDKEKAINAYHELHQQKVDVFYPAGDAFNIPVIEQVKEDQLYAIGYISDQSDLGELTVLTSTVQNVEKIYELIAMEYMSNHFQHGVRSFGFQDDAISLGKFSPEIPNDFRLEVSKAVKLYQLTGKLPNEL